MFGRKDFGDAHAEIVIQNENFPASDQPAVDENVDGISGQFIQGNNGAVFQLEHFFDEEFGPSEFNHQIEFDLLNRIPANIALTDAGGGVERLERERLGLPQRRRYSSAEIRFNRCCQVGFGSVEQRFGCCSCIRLRGVRCRRTSAVE